MTRRPTRPTPEKDAKFFKALAEGRTVHAAADLVQYDRTYVYDRRKSETDFARKWNEADETAIQLMEEEADRRGKIGWDESVFHNGKVVGKQRRHSDTLLIFRMKAKRPEVYRERMSVDANVHVTFGLADRLEAARKRAEKK